MYGPVFKTAFFFKPAVVFGSPEAIREFKEFEGDLPADAALPETFRELHTEYGALRMSGERHKATRANFGKVLGRSALTHYTPILAKLTRDFVKGELLEKGTLQPGNALPPVLSEGTLSALPRHGPPKTSWRRCTFTTKGCLPSGSSLQSSPKDRRRSRIYRSFASNISAPCARRKLDNPEYFFLKQYSQATDENGDLFTDERVAVTTILMIWGAFIEAAASMGHTTWLLMRNPDKAKKVRAECRSSFSREELDSGKLSLDDVYTKLTFTECAIKEALRVMPQTAGGLRVNPETRTLAGYTIPSGYVLTADPRIAFLNPDFFPDPEDYRPERFLPAENPAIAPDNFFPGGMGQHKCPGISLSNLMVSIYLVYLNSCLTSGSPTCQPREIEIQVDPPNTSRYP